jgi:hypothetical protein
MTSPAEDRAAADGLPVVAVIAHELLRAATGNPIIVTTVDGDRVLLRLQTTDEVLAAQAAARETIPEFCRPPLMSRARAADLAAPLRAGA